MDAEYWTLPSHGSILFLNFTATFIHIQKFKVMQHIGGVLKIFCSSYKTHINIQSLHIQKHTHISHPLPLVKAHLE